MRRGGSLAARLDRIERSRQRTRRAPVQPLIKVYDRDDAIIAIAGWTGATVERRAGEPLNALLARSRAALAGQGWLTARYAPEPPPEAMPGQSVPRPGASLDRNALAGIGRAATNAELRGMAKLANPADWLR